jgi:polar amino acid transport system substrate-binding protein
MHNRLIRPILVLLAVLTLVAAACGGGNDNNSGSSGGGGDTGGATAGSGSTASGADDLLARIKSDGVIRVSTDPAYPPQSSLNEDTGQYEGFDIDVTNEIAKRLGVKVEWQTPSWTALTSGGWSDRWDMSVGSMTVTKERAQVLDFTPAYYYTPASVAVHKDNTTIQNLDTDLDGKRIGVCGGCSYDSWLQGNLDIPGYTFDYIVDNPQIQTYDTDTTAIRDLALGDGVRLDAVISAQPTLQGAIDKGQPIKIVGDPVFYEPLAVAFDKSAPLDDTSLVEAVSQIIQDMHDDGTLTDLSMKWYGTDLTTPQS